MPTSTDDNNTSKALLHALMHTNQFEVLMEFECDRNCGVNFLLVICDSVWWMGVGGLYSEGALCRAAHSKSQHRSSRGNLSVSEHTRSVLMSMSLHYAAALFPLCWIHRHDWGTKWLWWDTMLFSVHFNGENTFPVMIRRSVMTHDGSSITYAVVPGSQYSSLTAIP